MDNNQKNRKHVWFSRKRMYWVFAAFAVFVLFLAIFIGMRDDRRAVTIDPDVEVIQGEPDFGEEAEKYHNDDLNFSLKYPKSARFDESHYEGGMGAHESYTLSITTKGGHPEGEFVDLNIYRIEDLLQQNSKNSESESNLLEKYVQSFCMQKRYIKHVQINGVVGLKIECIPVSDSKYPETAVLQRYLPEYFFERNGWVYSFNSSIGSFNVTDADAVYFQEFLKGFSLQ